MKKIIIHLVFLIAFSTCTFAQNFPYGINYQAVARDANGNAQVNQSVTVRFSIYKTTATGTLVWQETNNTTTNSMGQFNLVIGTGTTTGGGTATTFNVIDWAADIHFLKVELNVLGNYQPMGPTTQFQAVPYALATPEEKFAVFEERYVYPANAPLSTNYGLGSVSSLTVGTWSGSTGNSPIVGYIPLTVKIPSNTASINYASGSGLITLSPGVYEIRANTNNDVDVVNAGMAFKSRIIDAANNTVLAEGTSYSYSTNADINIPVSSNIDHVITVSNNPITIKFQRYTAGFGTGSVYSYGINSFRIPNEDIVLSKLLIKKIK